MNLSIKVRLENDEGGFKEEEISIRLRNRASLMSMTARTLLVEVPSVVEELFDEEREWESLPKAPTKKPPAKKPPAKKPAEKK